MNIQKATMPLKDGETYYMPIVFIASESPIQKGGGCFLSPSGNLIRLNSKSVSELMESPTTPILKCKDCKHADLFGSIFAAANILLLLALDDSVTIASSLKLERSTNDT